MLGRETPGQTTLRTGKELRIKRFSNAHDGYQVDAELDTYPHGEPRKELGVVAMYQTLKQKGSKAARFFEKQAIEEASQPTEEIEVVTG